MPLRKIATCCYCGTRAALVLTGEQRHELSCASCGAPLHNLKMLPISPTQATAPAATLARPRSAKRPKPAPRKRRKSVKKNNKRKGLAHKALSELWDVVDDIFD